ncbi:hypothetical protein GMES_3644 [Paraglaciecola mesophila KMM 241]|uniref:Uncharacterized protein n=1 Tax=Paraglaciecola mesophila KMM 241 TaxID=1128912 RepID=K6YPM4_9ALTE|nr:hypothetical protein GMES_3644 [Paraglaciecola mesophila KMM 241]
MQTPSQPITVSVLTITILTVPTILAKNTRGTSREKHDYTFGITIIEPQINNPY